jgi:3-oxoacyl-[acyl-carrier protein] reductase
MTVLVTGGSGAIGSAICRALSRQGASVAFTYRQNEARADELAQELERAGTACLAGRVEGTERPQVDAFVAQAEQRFGAIHGLVNNLGAIQVMPFSLMEEQDWDRMLQVNLKGMFLFTKCVARGMIRRQSGAIVNVGSLAASRMLDTPVHYATAKAGVTGFTLALAKELAVYGVRVNAVAPGLVDGGIGHSASETQVRDYRQFCSLGRTAAPAEIAEAVAFLLSPRSSFVNALSMVVDGGL